MRKDRRRPRVANPEDKAVAKSSGCATGAADGAPAVGEIPVRRCFGELNELLRVAKPDVVHVTTPPASHFEIAKRCLESGCHVYVEKPFTLDEGEARRLIALAEKVGLKLTAGHDDQFRHVARRLRTLVQSGFLGTGPVHMESYYCYELGPSAYAGAFLGDKQHWARRLPGKLLQNNISHGVAK